MKKIEMKVLDANVRINNLWLTAYKQAATAAFYREISGTEYTNWQ